MGQQQREELARKVAKIFKSDKLPKNIIRNSSYADARMFEKFLRGKKWTEISVEDARYFSGELSYLTQEGFHYYFPAFLRLSLLEPVKTDLLIDVLLSQLYARPYPAEHDLSIHNDKFELFTTEEKNLVREFLAKYLDLFDDMDWHHTKEDLALLSEVVKRWSI